MLPEAPHSGPLRLMIAHCWRIALPLAVEFSVQ
jgi:hypothetical protein